MDQCDFADLCLEVGRDVAVPEQEVEGLLNELFGVAELEVPVGAVLVGAFFGVHAVVDRTDDCFYHL